MSAPAISVLAASYSLPAGEDFVKAVAEGKVKISPSAADISHFENGNKIPHSGARVKLAHAFSVIEGRSITPEELFPEFHQ